MNKTTHTRVYRMLTLLTLLFGAVSAMTAADRFYVDAVNIEPGETRQIALNLDNSQEFYGFQADLELPEGVEFVTDANGKPMLTLSSRASDYAIVSNLLTPQTARIGAFSANHAAISGDSGALVYLTLRATPDFAGGALSLKKILFVNARDNDVSLPDYSIEFGTKHNDSFYIPDFKIAVGETKTLSMVLDNETQFTAFQADLYLPEGLSVVAGSFRMTARGASGHTVSAKSFDDGRTRIICLSLGNDVFSGNSGALLTFDITAGKEVAETVKIALKNNIFSMANAKEYALENSECTVTTERAPVEEITLDRTELSMHEGETQTLSATVLPAYASVKDLEWSSNNMSVATVSADGVVSAVGIGSAVITASAIDGSGVKATCMVTVTEVPVSGISLNKTTAYLKWGESLELVATIQPANATNKGVTWSSTEDYVTVSEDGLVTAVYPGTNDMVGSSVVITASSCDPAIKAECVVTIAPTPAESIKVLQPAKTELKAGETLQLVAEVSPEEATDKSVRWTSSDSEIATVDSNGVVSAIGVGEVEITATDSAGHRTSVRLTVVPTLSDSVVIPEPTTKVFKAGETIQLTATIYPATTTDKSVTWKSSDENIATVDANGLVTATGVGTVTITVITADGKTCDIVLTVAVTLAESITLNRTTASIKVGDSLRLVAQISPSTTTDKSVAWTSSDVSVAKVDADGVVTAMALGNCDIIAAANDGSGVSATCRVTVGETAAESISIDPQGSFTLRIGETKQFNATVLPATATDKSVTWSSDTEGVTVDETGLVTAVSPVVNNRITATNSAGQVDYVYITVLPNLVSTIEIDRSQVSLKVGESTQIVATVLPLDASDKTLKWDSADTGIATVDGNGNVTAVKVGETILTISATDGSGVSATCRVTVVETPAESISIDPQGSFTLRIGETKLFNATVLPATATDKSVAWTSETEGVTVDETGLVRAVSPVANNRITATNSAGHEDYVYITVLPNLVSAIEVDRSQVSLKVGESTQIVATVLPLDASDKTLKWESADTGIATVDGNGNVTAVKVGETILTISAIDGSGVSAQIKISVVPIEIEKVTISYNGSTTLHVGDKVKLEAVLAPENVTDKHISWVSQLPSVVTVDANGEVTAVGFGRAWVGAFSPGSPYDEKPVSKYKYDVVYFDVVPTPVEEIRIESDVTELQMGESTQLKATVYPENATYKKVVWSSSASAVATVDPTGLVEALSEGEAVITAMAESDSSIFDECRIKVIKKGSGIQDIQIDGLEVRVIDRSIIIGGADTSAEVRVYTTEGLLLTASKYEGADIRFEVPKAGCYILTFGNRSLKLMIN